MSENVKTASFVVAAAAVLVVALATRPASVDLSVTADTGTRFYPDFKDPAKAASLEIVSFDEATAQVKPFKVALLNNVWSIPSKQDYPADAERQIAAAAASVLNIESLSLVSESPGDHELYGVIDPGAAGSSTKGVATSVKFEDASGKVLCHYLIGKEVKDQPGIRYVRLPKRDAIYTAEIKTDKLSTRFEDWIEKDLLKLNAFDIREVLLNNYSIDAVAGTVTQHGQLHMTYNDKDAKWSLEGLAEGEELATDKVNDMRNALDDLKIVDVQRKPTGLSRDLRTAEGLQIDQEALMSLQGRGFFISQGQLLSNEGEVIVQMKDGVQYMLRFGSIALGTEQGKNEEKKPADGGEGKPADGEDPSKPGDNRYLFVTAMLNPDVIAKPQLEPVPGGAAGPAAPADGAPAADAPNEAAPAGADAAPAETPTPPPAENPGGGGDDAATAADTAADGNAATPPAAPPAEGATPAAPASPGAEKPAPGTPADIERQRVEKENKRKQDEYDAAVQAAQKRVDELNDRFADWYYVISDSVYKKIHLLRTDLIKTKETPAGQGNGPQDFDTLKQGLEADAPDGAATEGAPAVETAPTTP